MMTEVHTVSIVAKNKYSGKAAASCRKQAMHYFALFPMRALQSQCFSCGHNSFNGCLSPRQ